MSSISINTTDYVKPRTIEVDGMTWTMTAPGAGDELSLSQAQRRVKRLDQKIADGTATDEDYDLYDQLENKLYSSFKKIFNDGTPDNESVKEWLTATPMAVVMKAFEDITKQIEAKDSESAGENTERTQVTQ